MTQVYELTPWFPGSVKPERPGVYQRRTLFGELRFARWDGHQWLAYRGTPEAAALGTIPSAYPDLPWRGLAHDPAQDWRKPAAEWLRTRGKKGWWTMEELASEIERGL